MPENCDGTCSRSPQKKPYTSLPRKSPGGQSHSLQAQLQAPFIPFAMIRLVTFLLLLPLALAFQVSQFQATKSLPHKERKVSTSTQLSFALTKPAPAEERPDTGILRVHGPDRKGIVAAFAQLLFGQ